jgi:Tfp pilus assembly protein PilV
MQFKNRKYRGFLFTETLVSLVLLGFILTCLATSLIAFQRFNHRQVTQQRCIAAAQAQIECIELTGSELDKEVFADIWPKIDTTVQRSSGTGQWKELELLEVSARSHSYDKKVTVKLSRYVITKGSNQ